MGRRDYEGASISGLSGNVAGSSTSDVGSSQSIGQQASGRSFSGADLYDYTSSDGGPSTAASIRNALRGTPVAGMSFDQYKKSFGLSDTNPYGQTGFTQFMNKFGAKPNYTQQLSNLPRQGTTFRGNTLRTDATGKVLGSVNPITGRIDEGIDAATYNAPGAVAERIMQKQYDAYLNPFNLPQVPGFDPDYDTATQAEVEAGKITRGGRTDRGSYLGPLEEVVRPQSTGEMIARAVMPMGTGLLDTTDTYLSGSVTPEMRERGPQGLLGQVFQGATGVDPAQATSKAKSLGDGIRSLMDGRQTPAPVVDMTNRAGSMVPAAEEGFLPQGSPVPELDGVSLRSTYDFVDPNIREIGTPISVPESLAIARANEGLAMGPTEAGVPVPAPRPPRNAPNVGMPISPSAREDLDFVQFPELANAPNVGMRPATEDLDFVQFPELANAPNVGYERDLGPRTPDDLRSMGIEPTAQDLMNMQLSPTEMMQERARNIDTTYQGTRLPSDLRQADAVGATADTSSLSDFVEKNPGIGEALLGSREGQELNDIFKFGGLKPETSDVFVDTDKAEIRVQGPDFRGRNKGFTIDASEFFGKIDLGELVSDTLQKGGMMGLEESQRERSERLNREFLEGLEETERRAAEQGGIFSNIGYRG